MAHTYNLTHFGWPRRVDYKVRSSRPAWLTWWNPVSTKNMQISWCGGVYHLSYAGGWGRRITGAQEAKFAVIWDRTTALQPGWQREIPSQKKNSPTILKYPTILEKLLNISTRRYGQECSEWHFYNSKILKMIQITINRRINASLAIEYYPAVTVIGCELHLSRWIKLKYRSGTVAHIYDLSTLEGGSWWIIWAQEFETSRGNMEKPHLYWKLQKLAGHGGMHL